jgi:CheY-like chemotaxis protein
MPSTARSAVVLYDQDLRITQLNHVAVRLLGGRDWIGRPLAECLAHLGPPAMARSGDPAPDLREVARSGMTFMLSIGRSAWRAELTVLDAGAAANDGAGPPTDRNGCHAALILREAGDVEDYRDLALERIDFKAALAHDLRTPLNAMVGWLHLLKSSKSDNAESVARAMDGLRRAVEQQRALIDEKLGRPPAQPPPRAVDVAAGKATGESASPGRPADAGATDDGLNGVFVLAVDDKPEMLDVLSQVLSADGAVVVTETSADEALARYPQWAAGGGERLLVSDLAMPGRDGFSLIRQIRALERDRRLQRLPAVALSAHGASSVRRRAIEHGYDVFLDKPIDPPVLIDSLRRLLDR